MWLSNSNNNLVSTGLWWSILDWRDEDSNCDKPDVIIWTQTWAWCNSTLWTGIEYINEIYCYNYNFGNLWDWWDCGAWNYWDSTDKESDYYTAKWANSNIPEDIWVNNIWGKLYTWDNSGSACATWYHVPTDAEWEILETTLNWWTNCRNVTDWTLCDWLGWSGHAAKNNTNNIIEALQLPLSGHRHEDGTYYSRGYSTHLWSSTQYDATNARIRYLRWDWSTVDRTYRPKARGFTVRCIKD